MDATFIRVNAKKNPRGYSDSHGIALNWIFKNVVQKRKHDFAFLDHDIFPVKKININHYVQNQDFYGFKCIPHKFNRMNKKLWYLWPGFAFYKYSVLAKNKINFGKWRKFVFLKVVGADTGSANFPNLYSKYDVNSLNFANTSYWNIRKDEPMENNNDAVRAVAQTDLVQYFDNQNWLHMIDGSEWQDAKGKTEIVYKKLDKMLENIL